MLNTNFRKLLQFYCIEPKVQKYKIFKNVLGQDIYAQWFLKTRQSERCLGLQRDGWPQDRQSRNYYVGEGKSLSFNYDATTASNNLINEQTTYNWSGTTGSYWYQAVGAYSTYSQTSYANNGFTVFVGSGTTLPTINDFKLESPIALSVLVSGCYSYEDQRVVTTRVFQNNTGASVTISEIGLYMFALGTNAPIIMLGRRVLNNPIVLPDSESVAISYQVDLGGLYYADPDDDAQVPAA